MKKLSICIPTYNNTGVMHNTNYNNITMLEDLLSSIKKQTFTDYEIIISDHSTDDSIFKICEKWGSVLDIKYYRYTEDYGSCESNLNNAMSFAKGKYIKPILQDDFIYTIDALEKQVKVLDKGYKWVASGCWHINENNINQIFNPHPPKWTNDLPKLLNGFNLIGSPSVIMHVNDGLRYDVNLIWLMDVEFYYLLYQKYGLPLLIDNLDYISRLRSDGITNTKITNEIINEEKSYLYKKHILGIDVKLDEYPTIKKRVLNFKKRQNEKRNDTIV